ncbi:MAG: FapA family protein [Eubacteriales bacterium]|nr:FapA family protein [Eubacteriales bacterium]MDD4390112.1 FapA family protein [Eubacteriales bacterium]
MDNNTRKNLGIIEITVDDDAMTAYVKLYKMEHENPENIHEIINAALDAAKIVYGRKEEVIKKLAARPIFNIKIDVAKGDPPTHGTDGEVLYLVKKNSEYAPEYNIEGNTDYKNLDYLQLVKKGQILCHIKKESVGSEGINVFGKPVAGKNGRPPLNPIGKNTELSEDGTMLFASLDGQVDFTKDKVNINDLLKIREHVNMMTGNIDFSGDVNVGGDVQSGFSVKSGANISINGVVESADLIATGNVRVSKGINGVGSECIYVGGDLKCKYIENAVIFVEGDIYADYIINSRITCNGNIFLKGSRELVAGGEVKLRGELHAKDIGSEMEWSTKIHFIETHIIGDEMEINKLKAQNEEYLANMKLLSEVIAKFSGFRSIDVSPQIKEQVKSIKNQIVLIKEKISENTGVINKLESELTYEYHGSVNCKRKLYRGVKIKFGTEIFNFNLESLEHCKIYYLDGKIIQTTL